MNTVRVNSLLNDYDNYRCCWQVASSVLALATLASLVAMAYLGAISEFSLDLLSYEMGLFLGGCIAYNLRQSALGELALCDSILETLEFAKTGRLHQEEPPSRLKTFLTRLSWKVSLAKPALRKRKNHYEGLGEIAKSKNRGRIADMERYLSEPTTYGPRLVQIAKREGMIVTPTVHRRPPYSGGKCVGSALLYAKEYLLTGSLEKTAKLFEEGAPYEAVLLQHSYQHLFCHGVGMRPLGGLRERNAICNRVAAELAGLEIARSRECLSIAYTLEHLARCEAGVYFILTPVDPTCTGYKGSHALLLIKEEGRMACFDPNRATYAMGEEEIHRMFTHYGITENLPCEEPICINKLELPPGPGLNLYSSLTKN